MQAMQLSNGLANPVGLWLGHLMFDSLFTVFIATVIVAVFSTVSNKFHGPGFLVRVFPLRDDGTEYQTSYTVARGGPLRNYRHIVRVLRLSVHVFAPGVLRCRCGLPSRHVPGTIFPRGANQYMLTQAHPGVPHRVFGHIYLRSILPSR